jgi:hypothetical protein
VTIRQVAALLRSFDDEVGVAWLLHMHGIKGAHPASSWPSYSCRCPIARLAQGLTGIDEIEVERDGLWLGHEKYDCGYAVETFVDEYDAGAWPELQEAA